MDIDTSELDQLQADYKKAVEDWIVAIRKEEALASVKHSTADLDAWEEAESRSIRRNARSFIARSFMRTACGKTCSASEGGRGGPPSPRANLHRALRPPHRAGGKAQAVGPVGGGDEGQRAGAWASPKK